MDFSKFKKNTRYLFHEKNKDGNIKYFRATYLGIIIWKEYTTLVVRDYENLELNPNIVTLHKGITYIMEGNNIIIKGEILSEIIKTEYLNDDVLFEINKFF
jgi:hypothetical protein